MKVSQFQGHMHRTTREKIKMLMLIKLLDKRFEQGFLVKKSNYRAHLSLVFCGLVYRFLLILFHILFIWWRWLHVYPLLLTNIVFNTDSCTMGPNFLGWFNYSLVFLVLFFLFPSKFSVSHLNHIQNTKPSMKDHVQGCSSRLCELLN